jgi:YD repeat-containing protein
MICGCAGARNCCAPLGYLGAIQVTPTEATEANAVINEFAGTIETLIPWRSTFTVSPAGFVDPFGNTGTVEYDDSRRTISFTAPWTRAVRAAWDVLSMYATQHGSPAWGALPTDSYAIVNALPELRAAISATRAYVRADFDDANQAEADRIAATRSPLDSDAAYRFPVQTITSKPPTSAVAGVALGAGALVLLWLVFGRKRSS